MQEYEIRIDRLFGTFVYQKALGNTASEALQAALQRMSEYEQELSFYRVSSAVSRLNRLAGVAYTHMSRETMGLIQASKQISEQTDGLFDVTVAPLVKKWGINTPEARVVPEEELQAARQLVNYRDILLDEAAGAVKLRRQGQMIDLGGIAKGYIADRITELYREYGVESAILNIGGNVKVLGGKPGGDPWSIGIAYPDSHSERTVGALQIQEGSVVTSGGYERGFVAGGKLYHHILHPKTGCPVETDLKSVTVYASDSLTADAYSTPIYMMGLVEGAAFADSHGVEAVFINDRDEIYLTEGLRDKFNLHEPYLVNIIRRSK